MASDDKKTKVATAPKGEAAVKETVAKKKEEAAPKGKMAEGGEKAADPASGYSRGEGQKPVSQAYKDNWNAIYGKKAKKKKKR